MRRLLSLRTLVVRHAPGGVTAAAVLCRLASTAPPLSLLSWSVDATGHTHLRCKRRLSLQQRIPLLCSTIMEAAPDIVALQDSLPEVAEALCSRQPHRDGSAPGGVGRLVDAVEGKAGNTPEYEAVGSVRNGRCGYLQLFRRRDSTWNARLLPCFACLTVELFSGIHASATAASGGGDGLHLVLTNVDLSYRGRSLAVGGRPLVSPEVSANGSPFTLRVESGCSSSSSSSSSQQQQQQQRRVRGQLDPHREAALEFISQVARPDVLLGNFLMGRTETMSGYEDAWVLAGAAAEDERTTNTCARHKHDAETNYFYFLHEDTRNSGHSGGVDTAATNNQVVGTRVSLHAASSDAVGVATPVSTTSGDGGSPLLPQNEGLQVAGRFQRCFFRRLSSQHHKQQHPLFRRYERRRLVVLKPFMEAQLTAEEAERHGSDNRQVRCSASDGFRHFRESMLDADFWVTELNAALAGEKLSGNAAPSPLPANVLRAAYRFGTPCLCRHTKAETRALNCATSPWCFAGFQSMSTDTTAIMECIADIVGEGPLLLQQQQQQQQSNAKDIAGSTKKNANASVNTVEPSPLHRGIRNLGSTCYLNVVLQLLFNTPKVRHELLKACSNAPAAVGDSQSFLGEDDATKSIGENSSQVRKSSLSASGLGELFAELAFSRDGRGADTRSFVSFLSVDVQMQQDAQEFFALLIEWLRREGGEAIGRLFEGNLLYDRRCSSCGYSFKRAEPYYFLSLPVKGLVEEALNTLLCPEEVEGFHCDECGATATALSRQYVRTLPEVLVLHLNRFTFDLQTLQRKKLTKTVNFPLEWDLSKYVNQWEQRDEACGSAWHQVPSADARYALIGVVNHLGETAHSGHYTFHGKIDEESGWYQMDDAEVTKLHHRFHGKQGSSKDAYMLVYARRTTGSSNDVRDTSVDATRTPIGADGSPPFPILLPEHLMKHVQRLNQEVEAMRQAWESKAAEMRSFVQLWGRISQEILSPCARKGTPQLCGERESDELEDFFAVPSSWLQLLGRCFTPPFIDVQRYGAGGKRKKRVRGNMVSKGKKSILEVEVESAVSSVDGVIEGKGMAKEEEAEVSDELQTLEFIPLEGVSQSQLDAYMSSLRCPHGRLAPWGAYKLVPATAAANLAVLLREAPLSLTSCAALDKVCTPFVGWRVSEHVCCVCVATVAAEVQRLKASWEEEARALKMLDDSCGGWSDARSINSNNSNNNNSDNITNNGGDGDTNNNNTTSTTDSSGNNKNATGADEESLVFVGESVIEYWLQSLLANEKWKSLVSRQGFTGLVAASRLDQVGCDKVPAPSLSMPAGPLCDHRRLSPSAAVRVVPGALWRYLREHILQPLCCCCCCCCGGGGAAADVSPPPPPPPPPSACLEELLPFLPAKNTPRCVDCIRITVSATSERHLAKLAKMEEAKCFPTIAAASQILSLPQAEMEAQHPNRRMWKRNLERAYREHCRLWEKEQAAAMATIESQISALVLEEENERRAQEEWYNAMVVRGGRNRRGKNQSRGIPVPRTSNSASSPTLCGSGNNTTNGDGDTTAAAPAASALQLAREALAALRARTCPELYHAYGCIPMWWVVRWRQWHVDADGTVPPPPRFDHAALRCPHGGTLFAPHLLNLSDPFWEMRGVGNHFMQVWRRQVTASAAWDTDTRGFPPLLLVSMKEFVDVLKVYGQQDMLLPAEDADAVEGEEWRVNPASVVLFTEWNTKRAFDPPSCESCAAALLDAVKESFTHFVNGSLELQLHLRRSKKHFYDASDVLHNVHHTTTVHELKLAIVQRVKEGHGYMLPMKGMEILCRRKPLRRTRSSCLMDKKRDTTVHVISSSPSPPSAASASPPADCMAVDVDANSTTSSSPVDEEDYTIFECGICDGDVLTVNYTERPLSTVADTTEINEWEEVPTELLQSTPENLTAFATTRLYDAVREPLPGTGGGGVDSAVASTQLACCICTFINMPGSTICEMCETPLKHDA